MPNDSMHKKMKLEVSTLRERLQGLTNTYKNVITRHTLHRKTWMHEEHNYMNIRHKAE